MELNVPASGEVSHESPAVVQLHEDTKVPVSEIKAKLHNKVMELNQQRLAKPSEVPFGHTTDDMRDQSYSEVEDELLHPEEQQEPQDDQLKDFFGDTYPGADAFNAPPEEAGFDDGTGGDFGGGIDNNAMGFSDTDMDTLNATADNAFDDFTGEDGTETAGDVNNISAEEPGASEEIATDTVTDSATEAPAEELTPAEA